MNSQTIVMCVVALILGMLLANMLKNVCGCNNTVEGSEDTHASRAPFNCERLINPKNCKLYPNNPAFKPLCSYYKNLNEHYRNYYENWPKVAVEQELFHPSISEDKRCLPRCSGTKVNNCRTEVDGKCPGNLNYYGSCKGRICSQCVKRHPGQLPTPFGHLSLGIRPDGCEYGTYSTLDEPEGGLPSRKTNILSAAYPTTPSEYIDMVNQDTDTRFCYDYPKD